MSAEIYTTNPLSIGPMFGDVITKSDMDTAVWATVPNSNDIEKIDKRLETIEKRLCILTEPDKSLLDKYPSLKEAYDHYKLMEKLIGEHQDDS